MRRIVDRGQMLEIEVSIDLGGRDARMAQHFLDSSQIAGCLQKVRGEGVAQHVRVNVGWQALRKGVSL